MDYPLNDRIYILINSKDKERWKLISNELFVDGLSTVCREVLVNFFDKQEIGFEKKLEAHVADVRLSARMIFLNEKKT